MNTRFRTPNGQYTLRFGVTQGSSDTDTNLRVVDRIEYGPGGLALMHFADPVPEGTPLAQLSAQAPETFSFTQVYMWSARRTLYFEPGIVVDPVAKENSDAVRKKTKDWNSIYPAGIDPIVSSFSTLPMVKSLGSGIFGDDGELFGVYDAVDDYRYTNDTGRLHGEKFLAVYGQPVWAARAWIESIISGEGTSNPNPPADEGGSNGRELEETTTGNPPMSGPPINSCAEGGASCHQWATGVLLGSGNYRGTALAVCAQVAENGCSYEGTEYTGGQIGRLPLGSSAAPGSGDRKVVAWCSTSAVFAEGSPAEPALRVSFTNSDQEDVPTGYGWWDVTPDQAGTGSGQTPMDTTQLAAC